MIKRNTFLVRFIYYIAGNLMNEKLFEDILMEGRKSKTYRTQKFFFFLRRGQELPMRFFCRSLRCQKKDSCFLPFYNFVKHCTKSFSFGYSKNERAYHNKRGYVLYILYKMFFRH